MIHRNHLLACASVASLAFGLRSVPAAAEGQQPASLPATDTASDKTGAAQNAGNDTQIVITAQKRSENVQNVPISVAAFSGQTLIKSNVTESSKTWQGSLRTTQAAKGAQSSFMRVNIRGIGAIGNTTDRAKRRHLPRRRLRPARGAVVSSMLDMESVEVLRGPQGTLFGRNASVGALSLHTAAAEVRTIVRREVTGEVGTGDRYKLDGYRERAGRRAGRFPLRRLAAVVRRLLAQQARRQAGRRHRRHGPSRQLPRRGRARSIGSFRADYSKINGRRRHEHRVRPNSSVSDAQLERLQTRLARRPGHEPQRPQFQPVSSPPISTTSSGASTARCHGTSAAVRRCG